MSLCLYLYCNGLHTARNTECSLSPRICAPVINFITVDDVMFLGAQSRIRFRVSHGQGNPQWQFKGFAVRGVKGSGDVWASPSSLKAYHPLGIHPKNVKIDNVFRFHHCVVDLLMCTIWLLCIMASYCICQRCVSVHFSAITIILAQSDWKILSRCNKHASNGVLLH